MTTTVVTENSGSTPEVVEPPASSEAVVEAAVEIAEIEAERDVALAEIHTEAAVQQAEIEAEETEEDVQWLEERLAALESGVLAVLQTLNEQLQAMQAQLNTTQEMLTSLLILIPPLPAENQEVTAEQTPETPAADQSQSVDAVDQPAAKRRFRHL